MLKIIQTDPPAPTPNPFAFDPDTRPGEWVDFGSGEPAVITFADPSRVYSMKQSMAIQYCRNIHQLPDGRWVLGRDPALVKRAEPKVWTLGEIREKASLGDVFKRARPDCFYQYARKISKEVILVDEHGQEIISDGSIREREWHYLGNHTLTLTVGGPVKHPSEGE